MGGVLPEILKIIGCGVIYFLIVYLFVIRREAQPVIPWTVCILTQVTSTVFFQRAVSLFKTFLPEDRFGSLGMVIPSAILCVGNFAVIFLMFGKYMSKLEEKNSERHEAPDNIRVAPLPSVMPLGTENKNDAESDADITIDYIEKMIAEGRKDEAMKYLKMIAYYGKDEQSRSEALSLIASLTGPEE